MLVVCPASLKLNWRREIRLVDPEATIEVIGAKDGAGDGTPRWVVGHPSSRSFLSLARRYCASYRNDYGWVTDSASNLHGWLL